MLQRACMHDMHPGSVDEYVLHFKLQHVSIYVHHGTHMCSACTHTVALYACMLQIHPTRSLPIAMRALVGRSRKARLDALLLALR